MNKKLKAIQYDRSFLKKVLEDVRIPRTIGLQTCIQCGNCSSACPAARYTSYRPRKLIHDLLQGNGETILSSDEIWYCFSCFSCNLRCPRNNNPGIIIHILRDLAVLNGKGLEHVISFIHYLISLRDTGLGLTNISVPIQAFEEELGSDWVDIRKNLPKTLKQLGLNPNPPRQLPQSARDEIKKLLELAGINQRIQMYELIRNKVEG